MHQRQIVLPTSFGGKSWMLRFQHRTKSTIRLYFLPRGRIKPDDSDEYQTPSEEGDSDEYQTPSEWMTMTSTPQ
ncbi:MAG: hypothetical protein EBS09_11675 [Flavobacteriia bacterium]|nr:hypothetical protein [Flavobacteriia bacterium]